MFIKLNTKFNELVNLSQVRQIYIAPNGLAIIYDFGGEYDLTEKFESKEECNKRFEEIEKKIIN